MSSLPPLLLFFFNDPATTEIYTLSLHDALPIYPAPSIPGGRQDTIRRDRTGPTVPPGADPAPSDRKSTRLNSSHVAISYAVFCLKKKKKPQKQTTHNKTQNAQQTTVQQ